LTPNAGLAAVSELIDRLGVITALDAEIGSVKQRDRGISGAEVLVSLASCQLTGGDHLVSLDRLRADTAGQELIRGSTPASTTAAGVACRFSPEHLAGIETGIAVVRSGCGRSPVSSLSSTMRRSGAAATGGGIPRPRGGSPTGARTGLRCCPR
jgi:hypothetical protein